MVQQRPCKHLSEHLQLLTTCSSESAMLISTWEACESVNLKVEGQDRPTQRTSQCQCTAPVVRQGRFRIAK